MMKAQCERAAMEQTMGHKALFYTLGTVVIKAKGEMRVDLTVNSHITKRLTGKHFSTERNSFNTVI